MCRVDAYALSTTSIPESGHIGLQYSNTHGVRNIVFPVTMKTYLYPEAPEVESEDEEDHFLSDHANLATSFDTGVTPLPYLACSLALLSYIRD
jgi:hypothetical protein